MGTRDRGPALLVEAAERPQLLADLHEVAQRPVDRVGHQVQRHVVDRGERVLVDRSRRAARGRRHPALAVDDPRDRELLGHVVELVPLVVGPVLGRIGDLGEGEEADADLVHDRSIRPGKWRARDAVMPTCARVRPSLPRRRRSPASSTPARPGCSRARRRSRITIEAALGALADAGLDVRDVNGVIGALEQRHRLRPRPRPGVAVGQRRSASRRSSRPPRRSPPGSATSCSSSPGSPASTRSGRARRRGPGPTTSSSRPTACSRPPSSRSIARRHMHMYGTTAEQMATVAATIRNNGHVQSRGRLLRPWAVHAPGHPRLPHGGRPVPPPRLRDDGRGRLRRSCSPAPTGCPDLAHRPVYLLGGSTDRIGPSYRHAPAWDLRGRDPDGIPNGYVGRRAARRGVRRPRVSVPTTSTSASSTTRSRSRSSASSRRSASAARARAATS